MALPPLLAIEALDRIDRLGAAHRAAAALSITPSAVSHRLRALEAALGYPCVTPEGRGLGLTPRGARFLAAARPALSALAAAAAGDGRAADGAAGPLTISAPPGFAAAWLCPRLDEISTALPGLRLTLTVAGEGAAGEAAADVAIRFSPPEKTPPGARPLLKPDFFPVCAPSLLHALEGLRRPAALAGARLLHLYDEGDWRRWGAAAGAPSDLTDRAARDGRAAVFGDVNLLLAAALAGQGVALGDPITCAGFLAEGALARPFAATTPSARAYVLSLAPDPPPAARRFADWLIDALA